MANKYSTHPGIPGKVKRYLPSIHDKTIKYRFMNWGKRPRTYRLTFNIEITLDVPNVSKRTDAVRIAKQMLVRDRDHFNHRIGISKHIKSYTWERIW